MKMIDCILSCFALMGATQEQLEQEYHKLMMDDEYFLDCCETYLKQGIEGE